ncbi:hypothetical protein ACHQM5_008017 [Ranunculus cassubicifolius]
MNGLSRVLFFVFVALAAREVFAAQHAVNWDLSSDWDSWAFGQTFKVGDQLVFKYSPGLHSVVEVSSEKEYKSCDIGNALNSMSNGNDAVKLTKPGTRYFTCGTLGHCDQGMKVEIKTVAGDGSTAKDSPSSSSTTTPSTSIAAHSVAAALSLVLGTVIIGLLNIII